MLAEKVILITGGTGSFGQAFVREALKHSPTSIRVFSRGEYAQWEMQQRFNNAALRFFIGDVRDRRRLFRAMQGVDYVVHAAALKHITFCEYNPIEAVKTNIDGSVNVIEAALDCGVDKVLAVSSDKAVHPINIYGATKLAMEKLFINANVYGDTKFSFARFGNFINSRGSVLELWEREKPTGKITITNPDMTRYWISLEDAAQFTIDCLEQMEGGETFIPAMEQKSISQLAEEFAPDCSWHIIGGRDGEKVTEELYDNC